MVSADLIHTIAYRDRCVTPECKEEEAIAVPGESSQHNDCSSCINKCWDCQSNPRAKLAPKRSRSVWWEGLCTQAPYHPGSLGLYPTPFCPHCLALPARLCGATAVRGLWPDRKAPWESPLGCPCLGTDIIVPAWPPLPHINCSAHWKLLCYTLKGVHGRTRASRLHLRQRPSIPCPGFPKPRLGGA